MTRNTALSLACGSIWLAVAAMSVFAPDLVSGSEHEHLPLAGMTAWIWGLVASGYVAFLFFVLGDAERPAVTAGAVAATWALVALVAIFGPVLETGSDPTELPLAALIAPPVAAVITGGVCLITAVVAHTSRHSALIESKSRLGAVL